MAFPSRRATTLHDHLTQQNQILVKKVAEFTLEDLKNSTVPDYAARLVDSVLSGQSLSIKSIAATSHPSKDVHYTKLQGQTNVGLNLRDVIVKTWEVEGPQQFAEFMPLQVQEATRTGKHVMAELIMALGALSNPEVLKKRKTHLADITSFLEKAATDINSNIAKQRAFWMEAVVKQITERQQQLLAAAVKKKEVDDFLNS